MTDPLQLLGTDVGAVDGHTPAEGDGERDGNVACAVIKAGEVGARSEIDQALVARGLGVSTERGRHREEGIVGRVNGAQVDHPAAELARKIDRIGFLDGDAFEDAGGKEVQRHDALQGLRARERRTVQQGGGIAFAKAADVDEAALDDRQTCHAGQGTGGAAVAGPLEVLGREEGRNLGAFAVGFRDIAAENDDLVQFAGRFRLVLGGRILIGGHLGGGLGRRGLSKGEPGRDQRAGGQEDPAQGQGNGLHDLRLEEVQRTGRKQEAALAGRLPILRQQLAPAVRPQVQPCHQVSEAFWTAPM